MVDKYNMSKKDNIFYAKRSLVDMVYKSANLEGIAVTFAQTIDILNDAKVNNLKPSEISKVCDLRDGWQFIFEKIEEDADLNLVLIEETHENVVKSDRDLARNEKGFLRTSDVMISGTNWRPPIPDGDKIQKELEELQKIPNNTDRAITTMLWLMRTQMFKDGNKRVATMICNKILIGNGNGIMSIPVDLDGKFKEMLVKYYETNDMTELKQWIYNNCIDGIEPTIEINDNDELDR